MDVCLNRLSKRGSILCSYLIFIFITGIPYCNYYDIEFIFIERVS